MTIPLYTYLPHSNYFGTGVGIPQRMDDVKEYSVSELRTVVVAIIPHLMDFCGTVQVLQCSSK